MHLPEHLLNAVNLQVASSHVKDVPLKELLKIEIPSYTLKLIVIFEPKTLL